MNRRDFLKVSGITALVLALPVWKFAEYAFTNPEAEYQGRVYRGSAEGEIHVSGDQRQTWQKLVGFGSEYRVSEMYAGDDGLLHAQLKYEGMPFYLTLAEDGKNWLLL